MDKHSKIFVAGHNGLAGSAIVRNLKANGYTNVVTIRKLYLDLRDGVRVDQYFRAQWPEYVFLCAAKVGGIVANEDFPVDFIQDNIAIQSNIIRSSHKYGVRRLIVLGSTCIYPRDCPQPIREESLMTGPLEPTNSAYAMAKLAGLEMCRAYNYQFGTKFLGVMPTNLYGLNDSYHPAFSHVLPGLIRRFHEAKLRGDTEAIMWGTGTPRREFLYADDMASACTFLMNLGDDEFNRVLAALRYPIINIGYGEDAAIGDVARLVADVVGFKGKIVNDTSKPDGMPRKLADSSRLFSLGWTPRYTMKEGLAKTYANFLARQEEGTLRG